MECKCIFCKDDSSSSKSVEHILPESLGNTEYTLPKGIVCDKCNNYFSRKLESIVLSYRDFKIDRFHMSIPSKKGKIPSQDGIIRTIDGYANIHINKTKDGDLYIDHPKTIKLPSKGRLFLPAFSYLQDPIHKGKVSKDAILSRFIAKIAFEYLSLRLLDKPELFQQIYDLNYDDIRRYIRYGNRRQDCEYPVLVKTSYPTDKIFFDEGSKEHFEVLHEFEFIFEGDKIYFSVIIFGIEYRIFWGILIK